MSSPACSRARAVTAGFDKLGVAALCEWPAQWKLMLVNGRPLSANARLDDGWLTLETELAVARPPFDPWRRLLLAAELPGSAKLVDAGSSLAVRAELRADLDEATFRRRLAEACEAVVETARRVEGKATTAPRDPVANGEPAVWDELVVALGERHWPAREHGGPGRWSVALGLGAGSPATSAEIAHGANGATTLSVALTPARERPPASRTAIACYLVTSAAELRLVRAAAARDGGTRFEVRFESRPAVSELDEALGALATAARLAAPVAVDLEEPSAGAWYLAVLEATLSSASQRGNRVTSVRARRGRRQQPKNRESEVNRGNS